jgi:hypothetical protein
MEVRLRKPFGTFWLIRRSGPLTNNFLLRVCLVTFLYELYALSLTAGLGIGLIDASAPNIARVMSPASPEIEKSLSNCMATCPRPRVSNNKNVQ